MIKMLLVFLASFSAYSFDVELKTNVNKFELATLFVGPANNLVYPNCAIDLVDGSSGTVHAALSA